MVLGVDVGVQSGMIVDIVMGKGLLNVILDEVYECPAGLSPWHVDVGIFLDFCWVKGHWP